MSEETGLPPQQLGSVLGRLIRKRGLADRSAAAELDGTWKKLVGEDLGRHSKAQRLRAGVLEVDVFNSAVLEQLRGFLHQELLKQLQLQLPKSEIKG
ncbi:MAG: DUF721 domain-containing protein, partial [Planctomycetaceae bacterium]|nr:DUF721 domain-containing protein [Planctomycetaceae bacterium]